MHINIETEAAIPSDPLRPGNVYAARGGRRMASGQMYVVLAIFEPESQYEGRKAIILIINKEGRPVGATHYSVSYFEDKVPIAFVEGIEDIELVMRSI